MGYNELQRGLPLLVLGLACYLTMGQALAEHEVDHRYVVRGYLLDAAEGAIAGREVVVFGDGKRLGDGKSDSSGFYSLHLHLHDEDLNRELTLRAGSSEARIRVRFDPADKSTVRVHEANFVGGEFVEGDLGRFRLPTWIYIPAGLFVIFFFLVILEKRRRGKLRKKAVASAVAAGRPKSKKRRRKR